MIIILNKMNMSVYGKTQRVVDTHKRSQKSPGDRD